MASGSHGIDPLVSRQGLVLVWPRLASDLHQVLGSRHHLPSGLAAMPGSFYGFTTPK